MELTFQFNEGGKWQNGVIVFDNLKIDLESNDVIEYDKIGVILDKKPYDNSESTWAGQIVDNHDFFAAILNAYLRNDTENFKEFGKEWEVFNKLESFKKVNDDGLVLELPVYLYDDLKVYTLQLATPNTRYYCCDNGPYFLVLDTNGDVLTDMDVFYSSAMNEDLCAIIKKELTCLFMNDDVKEFIKECGGEQGFLDEFDE